MSLLNFGRTAGAMPTAGDRPVRRRLRPLLGLIGLLGTGACVSDDRSVPPSPVAAPAFDPVVFFQGRTHGTGTLHVALKHPQTTDVRGNGVASGDDGILLDQDVTMGRGKPKHRSWRLRRIGVGRYAGTLTDAVGTVTAQSQGNVLQIDFAMKGGLKVEQRLYLQPGGQVALNTMVVRKLGVVVARLDERIERER
jgi:hypothetical protein